MRYLKLAVIFLVLICSKLICSGSLCVEKEVIEIKKTKEGGEFLLSHSEKNLKFVILFLDNPNKYCGRIDGIQDIFEYISVYDYFSLEKNKESVMSIFLRKNFKEASQKNISMISCLILKCKNSSYCGELVDWYTSQFKSNSKNFLSVWRNTNWKAIINMIYGGSWNEFQEGLSKLEESSFKREILEYIKSLK